MNKKINTALSIIIPNKKINLFVLFVIILGVISGSIFLIVLSENDKNLVIYQITNFMKNINSNNINNVQAFKNSLIENFIFIILIWVLGMSIIGIIFNVFLIYFRGFIIGFSVSSFILIYKFKGLLAGFIYIFPTCLISILVTLILGSYMVMLVNNLWKTIFSKKRNINMLSFLKKYLFILIIVSILTVFASLCESYLVPSFLKLFIKMFI